MSLLHINVCQEKSVRDSTTVCPRPRDLDLESGVESRVMWATSVLILVFLGLSVLDLGLMYATDRQTRQTASSLNALAY